MSGVPYVFGNATTSIPLSNLDANFNTPVTLGNTTVGLGNTVTTVGNLTLQNATLQSLSAPLTVAEGGTNSNIGSPIAKAWIQLYDNGTTVVINKSFNVTSVTRNATCDWTINLTNAVADKNSCVVGCAGLNTASQRVLVTPLGSYDNGTTSVRVQATASIDGVLASNAYANIAIFD